MAINSRQESLSAERLRTFSGCENLSDEEAEQIITDLKLLSTILLGMLREQENNNIEINQAA